MTKEQAAFKIEQLLNEANFAISKVNQLSNEFELDSDQVKKLIRLQNKRFTEKIDD